MMVPVEDSGGSELSGDRAAPSRKAATAFRTISEVADDLHVPQHVLRFWETRFTQVKPLKRGGGRRYYRPDDVVLLRRIADLLYVQGYTIKGVQRLLVEGDGTLQGDLPPPDDADRDEDVDFAGANVPLFGRDVIMPIGAAVPARVESPPASPAADPALRDLLEEILGVLEAVRRQMPL